MLEVPLVSADRACTHASQVDDCKGIRTLAEVHELNLVKLLEVNQALCSGWFHEILRQALLEWRPILPDYSSSQRLTEYFDDLTKRRRTLCFRATEQDVAHVDV